MIKATARQQDNTGQGMIEYTLIVGLLAVFVMAIMMSIGPALNDLLQGSVDGVAINEAHVALSSQFYTSSASAAPVVIDPLTGLPI